MAESTVTAKGQTTIPKAIRDHLGLRPGGKVKFFVGHDGRVTMLPALPLTALRGIVKYNGPPVSIEEMDDAIADALAEKHGPQRRR
jgi:antitoxin PrlF